jgi:hypothetical protein
MGELRAQMGEIAEATAMTPSARGLTARAIADSQASRLDVEVDATDFMRAPPLGEPAEPPAVAAPDEPSASALRLTSTARIASRRPILFLAAGAAVLLGTLVFALARSPESASVQAAPPAQGAVPEPPSASEAPVASAPASPASSAPASAASSAVASVALLPARPLPPAPAPAPALRPAKKQAHAPAGPSPLAPSPY